MEVSQEAHRVSSSLMNFTFRQVASRPDKEGCCRIVLDVTWDGGRLKLPTGVSCLPKHFSAGGVRPVSTKDPASARLNATLAAVVARVEKAALKAAAEDRPLLPSDLQPEKRKKKEEAPVELRTAAQFYAAWQADNPGQTYNSARRYQHVVAHLDAYHANWEITAITRKEFQEYLSHLAELNLVDATAHKHVKFFRECFRLANLAMPSWLTLKVRYGRAPALQASEFAQLLALKDLSPEIEQERDLFVFQAMLLLRDSDLRALRPHHIQPVVLPGCGQVPVLTFRQAKTGDEVRLPLPPAAVAIWERMNSGAVPAALPVQQERNRRLKQLARVAQLTRPFVKVHYVKGEPTEEVFPLYKVVTTHTARHTGADLVMLGSGGDSNLKEKALGHAGVYGHDSLERYGPALLEAWENVLGAMQQNAPKKHPKQRSEATGSPV